MQTGTNTVHLQQVPFQFFFECEPEQTRKSVYDFKSDDVDTRRTGSMMVVPLTAIVLHASYAS